MKKFLTCSVFVLGMLVTAQAQPYEKALNKYAEAHPVHKIYVQYDKDFYVPGETVWFKAYLFTNDKPDVSSSNLWVQLADKKGTVIVSQRYPVMGAVANGSIALPDTLKQDNYFVRAVTASQLNGNESLINKKELVVLKAGGKTVMETEPAAIQFFPESGSLVDGILTVVGFKATGKGGTPVDATGLIKTEDGTTIAPFSTYYNGLGRVQFKPQAGKKYFAEIETNSGTKKFALPDVSASGIILKIQDEKGGKKFQISRSVTDKRKFDSITVVGQINGHVVYETDIAFEDYPSIVGHILTDSLPSGILQLNVFNTQSVSLAERLTFVDNGEYRSSADIAVVKKGLGKREENVLGINFPDAAQRSLSVVVTDYNNQAWGDAGSIASRILLADNLNEYVWNPDWYFAQKNDSTSRALDYLLITSTPRWINWSQVLRNQTETNPFADQHFIKLTGQVADEKTKSPLGAGKLSLLLEAGDSTRTGFEIPVDANGRFVLDSMYYAGKGKIYYGYTDSKGKSKPALVIPDEDELSKKAAWIPVGFADQLVHYSHTIEKGNNELENRFQFLHSGFNEEKVLEKVTVESERKKSPLEQVNEKYTTGVFRSDAKEAIDNINNPVNDKSMNAVDFVKNRIQQLEISGDGFVNRKNMSLNSGRKWAVGIFLNEVPANLGLLRTILAKDIALVKFFEAGFVGVGSSYPGGAVAVYTKEKFGNELEPEKLEYFEKDGFTSVKKFISPDYSQVGANKVSKDNRTTLYWNPAIFTDANSKSVQVKFYNNDFSKKLRVVIEGIDAAGKLIHVEKIIGE